MPSITAPIDSTRDALDCLSVTPPPWFATHNPYIGKPGPICFYQLEPFPAEQFCALSPWASHVVIAHDGVMPHAKAAGFNDVAEYLKAMIANAASRNDNCLLCPNKACAPSRVR